jgi:hypothetical protein
MVVLLYEIRGGMHVHTSIDAVDDSQQTRPGEWWVYPEYPTVPHPQG